MDEDEARALEQLIHDRYADVLELRGIWKSGNSVIFVSCWDIEQDDPVRFYHAHDLVSDYGERPDNGRVASEE